MSKLRTVILTLATACGPTVVDGDPATTGNADTTGAPTTSATTMPMTGATTSRPDDSGPIDTGDPTDDPSSDTITPLEDIPYTPIECSLWDQDCGDGFKCVPYANDGGSSWNATMCVPIPKAPRDVGESCTVRGDGVSGIDDCDVGAMCFDVDPDTNMGECFAFCTGNEAEPVCDQACTRCNITSEGLLTLCLPICDPIAQDCGRGDGCYPVNENFACAPYVDDEDRIPGTPGAPCEFLNVCEPGNFCADAARVPGCDGGSTGCCAPLCDVDADDCGTTLPGTTCLPWYEEGTEPKSCEPSGLIGACLLPDA